MATMGIAKDKTGRSRFNRCIVCIAEGAERAGCTIEKSPVDCYIEIVVVTRLSFEECVDAPAAIQPDVDSVCC